jgi:hypothetical protein
MEVLVYVDERYGFVLQFDKGRKKKLNLYGRWRRKRAEVEMR